jgi:hypothetical protein
MTPEQERELEASIKRGLVTALASGPLNIFANLGPGQALAAGGIAAVVQLVAEVAAAKDGRQNVVATGFTGMEPAEVEDWLERDTRNLTLAVQAVIHARAAYDEQKLAALGRAFRTGVTDSARVDESLLVVAALGTLERPHIDLLHAIAFEEPPPSEEQDRSREYRGERLWPYPMRPVWFIGGLRTRLPHLHEVIPWLEFMLRSNGITENVFTNGGGPISDAVQLTMLGQRCTDYLSAGP